MGFEVCGHHSLGNTSGLIVEVTQITTHGLSWSVRIATKVFGSVLNTFM